MMTKHCWRASGSLTPSFNDRHTLSVLPDHSHANKLTPTIRKTGQTWSPSYWPKNVDRCSGQRGSDEASDEQGPFDRLKPSNNEIVVFGQPPVPHDGVDHEKHHEIPAGRSYSADPAMYPPAVGCQKERKGQGERIGPAPQLAVHSSSITRPRKYSMGEDWPWPPFHNNPMRIDRGLIAIKMLASIYGGSSPCRLESAKAARSAATFPGAAGC